MSRTDVPVFEGTADPGTLDQIEAVLRRAWVEHPEVPNAVRIQVGIAVSEVAANIIEHAGRGGPVWIRMEVGVRPHEVCVEFADDGVPAEVDLAAVTPPDAMAERGRGLALTLSVLERLTYRRTTVNHWTLVSKPFG